MESHRLPNSKDQYNLTAEEHRPSFLGGSRRARAARGMVCPPNSPIQGQSVAGKSTQVRG